MIHGKAIELAQTIRNIDNYEIDIGKICDEFKIPYKNMTLEITCVRALQRMCNRSLKRKCIQEGVIVQRRTFNEPTSTDPIIPLNSRRFVNFEFKSQRPAWKKKQYTFILNNVLQKEYNKLLAKITILNDSDDEDDDKDDDDEYDEDDDDDDDED